MIEGNMIEGNMIVADTSRSAAEASVSVAGIIGWVRERVIVRAAGRQRGSVWASERVVIRAPGRQRRQLVNPRRS